MKRALILSLLTTLAFGGCQKVPDSIKVTAVTLDMTSLVLTEGETGKITATVSPSNAYNQKVLWTTNHPDIATVNNGIVTAVKEGTATITATSDSEGKTATCSVTVKAKRIAVEGVSLDKTKDSLTVGETITLTATVKPDDATDKTVTWSTSDATVATVKDGLVTALKIGSATITAKAGDKIAACAVTVKEKPLTFKSTGSTTLELKKAGNPYNIALEYRLNNGSWTSYTIGTAISLNDKDQVAFQASEGGNSQFSRDYNSFYMFSISGKGTVSASGNIMLLVDQNITSLTIPYECYFNHLFSGCTGLTQAPELPATSLTKGCYLGMFSGCTGLIQAPELPATNLAIDCYMGMFDGCTSLTQAPELPATNLAGECYHDMFRGCTGLTKAPELPATTLDANCYLSMFNGCTALTQTPELPATNLAASCYESMFYGCSGLTQAPKLPATTLDANCYLRMFYGCIGLTQAPELPATNLAASCYESMFNGCTGLIKAPKLPATSLASFCYYNMFRDCTGLTQAPELPATTLVSACYGNMFRGCTGLNYVKALFLTTPSSDYTYYWLSDVSSTGTFIKNSSATWDVTGENGIPSGWTVQTE